MKLVGVPELGIQNGPAGSAGSQPVAGVPAVANANSWKVPNGIGPALAGVVNAIASAAVIDFDLRGITTAGGIGPQGERYRPMYTPYNFCVKNQYC